MHVLDKLDRPRAVPLPEDSVEAAACNIGGLPLIPVPPTATDTSDAVVSSEPKRHVVMECGINDHDNSVECTRGVCTTGPPRVGV
jgi:hypothetical protein